MYIISVTAMATDSAVTTLSVATTLTEHRYHSAVSISAVTALSLATTILVCSNVTASLLLQRC